MDKPERKYSFRDLIGLIVAGFIVLALVAMLLPAMHSGGRDRLPRCMNNLKQIGLATHNFEAQKDFLPGYVQSYGIYQPPSNGPANPNQLTSHVAHEKVAPWPVALLPYLEQQAVFEIWSTNRYPVVFVDPYPGDSKHETAPDGFDRSATPTIEVMQCPDAQVDAPVPGQNSYVCNAGLYVAPDSANFLASMSSANGVFNNRFPGRLPDGSVAAVGPKVTWDDFHDGLSATLLFTENLQALPWYRAGFITADDLRWRDGQAHVAYEPTSRLTQGVVWHLPADRTSQNKQLHRINSSSNSIPLEALKMTPENARDLARPSSLHPEGVYIALADGSVRFLRETVDYQVYQSLLAPNDSASGLLKSSGAVEADDGGSRK